MEKKVSDLIAEFFKENKIKTVFGIIGAGDAHIFDAIYRLGYTEIVCVHHEQAAVMAMGAYYRTNGQITATIATTGAGTTNTITGLVSCWMDSTPGIIIVGNEKSTFCDPETNPLRIWGVQGFDSISMVDKVTKYSKRVLNPNDIIFELEKAKNISLDGRKGPTWLEIPMDIQSASVKLDKITKYKIEPSLNFIKSKNVTSIEDGVEKTIEHLKEAKRPLIWLGNGIRLADAQGLIKPIIEKINTSCLVTWQAIDIISSEHSLVFGRAGVYGQRHSNFILQNSDLIISIGTRFALPQIGYDINELAREAKIICIDIDQDELKKYESRLSLAICADAKIFMTEFYKKLQASDLPNYSDWIKKCNHYKKEFPVIGTEHKDQDNFINSYPFLKKLSDNLNENEVIVTDMGTALLSGFQVISVTKNQKMFTSTGLGEMGYGLPAAIGASFAGNKSSVLCLNCDGGMMMNLQELQTIAHYQLPIKILIFNNDGYLMIKNTQKGIFDGRFTCVNKDSGVSCPDYSKLALAFGFKSYQIKTWEDVDKNLNNFLNETTPVICEVFIHPEQLCVPKLGIALTESGEIVSPPLEDLSPLIDRDRFKQNMIIRIHPKSEKLV